MKFVINEAIVSPFSVAQLRKNWVWYLTLGIGLVIVGFLAVAYSFTSTVFSMTMLGMVFIVAGIFEGIKSVKINLWGSFFLHLLLSLLYLVSGVFVMQYPIANAISLTLFLAILFVMSGILKIFFALTKPVPHKEWLLLNGVITIVLGVLIWQQWPGSGLWVIGMLLGIDLLVTGWTWILLACAARNLKGVR